MKKVNMYFSLAGMTAAIGLLFTPLTNSVEATDDGFGHNKRFDQQWGAFSDDSSADRDMNRDSRMNGENGANRTNRSHTESGNGFIGGETTDAGDVPRSEPNAGGVPETEEDALAPGMSRQESDLSGEGSAESDQEALEEQLVEELLGEDSAESDPASETVLEEGLDESLQEEAVIEESTDEVDETDAAEEYYEEAENPLTENAGSGQEYHHFPVMFSRILLAGIEESTDGEDSMNEAYEAALETTFNSMPYMLELDYPSLVLAASDILEAESGEDPWQGEIPAEALIDFWAFFELNDELHDFKRTSEIIAALKEHYSEYEGETADRVNALEEAAAAE
ncbi:hypothetical protein [Salisediminibacterium halotolerans]|uniref:hypothetical protein n=1 Tax=Salisediminibacterium halotolerans TaxID=517425 RepID=UPI000EAD7D0C|nr:hypothetical protein [Salisediminibacterium halotolerans]RLJ75634.1 hypothetical protein BCL39_1151 [Actinophytocola xinjiangensis]RPE89488.1 hypothetical protein EDD67_0264 [Salisediminibacterium halotolerans]TWG36247.1 hypothetical protein BCL52_1148 [Salisediminibacterium halotolerans]GEL08267.1 hypothetical protein SHA02_16830 [Salisediminibacterium halotolerans]